MFQCLDDVKLSGHIIAITRHYYIPSLSECGWTQSDFSRMFPLRVCAQIAPTRRRFSAPKRVCWSIRNRSKCPHGVNVVAWACVCVCVISIDHKRNGRWTKKKTNSINKYKTKQNNAALCSVSGLTKATTTRTTLQSQAAFVFIARWIEPLPMFTDTLCVQNAHIYI